MLRERSLHISNVGRQQIRERVVHEFLKEEPGSGTGELASKYNYYVETLTSGKRIYLARPAPLNKGFDFIIRVEGINFGGSSRRRSNPRHQDIIGDLEEKKLDDGELYKELFCLIQRIHACQQDITEPDYKHLHFKAGYTADLILLVIKWLFIEQDVTYWNFSGRNMFMSKIPLPI